MQPYDPTKTTILSSIPYAMHEAAQYFDQRRRVIPRPEHLIHFQTMIDEYDRLSRVALKHIPMDVLNAEGFRVL